MENQSQTRWSSSLDQLGFSPYSDQNFNNDLTPCLEMHLKCVKDVFYNKYIYQYTPCSCGTFRRTISDHEFHIINKDSTPKGKYLTGRLAKNRKYMSRELFLFFYALYGRRKKRSKTCHLPVTESGPNQVSVRSSHIFTSALMARSVQNGEPLSGVSICTFDEKTFQNQNMPRGQISHVLK